MPVVLCTSRGRSLTAHGRAWFRAQSKTSSHPTPLGIRLWEMRATIGGGHKRSVSCSAHWSRLSRAKMQCEPGGSRWRAVTGLALACSRCTSGAVTEAPATCHCKGSSMPSRRLRARVYSCMQTPPHTSRQTTRCTSKTRGSLHRPGAALNVLLCGCRESRRTTALPPRGLEQMAPHTFRQFRCILHHPARCLIVPLFSLLSLLLFLAVHLSAQHPLPLSPAGWATALRVCNR